MTKRSPVAGGFLIVVAILVGFVGGIILGRPMDGVLIGTIGGIAAAVILWLVDRRQS